MADHIRRAVITGATGAVGTAVVRELIRRGAEVLVLAREGSARNSNIPQHELVRIKYCSLDELASLENESGQDYDAFFHLAWAGTTGQARNDMYLQNQNVRYALDAVGAAHRLGCRVFIGTGSQAEYGRHEGILTPETPVFPETGYGMGKLAAGHMTRSYAHQLGMKHIWTRILSIYGPHDTDRSLVMTVINELLAGNVPQLTKGDQMWDYLYSDDAARALVMLAESGQDGSTYVLGSGTARPLRSYIEDIRDVVSMGAKLGLGAIDYYPGQVMFLKADTSEIEKDTGWKAEISFENGIREILNDICKEP